MKRQTTYSPRSIYLAALALVIAALISSCSSSSKPSVKPSDDINNPNENSSNTTLISIDITVPARLSDELQVHVQWSETESNANWVVGRSWTAELELPAQSEELLVVTFYDLNGAVTLASFEQVFKTPSSATGTLKIESDQFDTQRWDDDNDGISNLDELIAGSYPLTSAMALSNPFSSEQTEPLLARIQEGSALSITNYSTFLRAYYRLGGATLLHEISSNMNAVSFDIRAALLGNDSGFVAESTSSVVEFTQATFSCPAGGRVSASISNAPKETAGAFNDTITEVFSDTLTYDNCKVGTITYNGQTNENEAFWTDQTSKITARRYGGYTPDNSLSGFGKSDQRFTIRDDSGVKVTLFIQQSQADSTQSYPIHQWFGNWRLEQGERSLTIENMDIRSLTTQLMLNPRDYRVSPYFTLTGDITNGRTVTAINVEPLIANDTLTEIPYGNQNITDADGGRLNLVASGNDQNGLEFDGRLQVRIDTEGQILEQVEPLSDETFLLFRIDEKRP